MKKFRLMHKDVCRTIKSNTLSIVPLHQHATTALWAIISISILLSILLYCLFLATA